MQLNQILTKLKQDKLQKENEKRESTQNVTVIKGSLKEHMKQHRIIEAAAKRKLTQNKLLKDFLERNAALSVS